MFGVASIYTAFQNSACERCENFFTLPAALTALRWEINGISVSATTSYSADYEINFAPQYFCTKLVGNFVQYIILYHIVYIVLLCVVHDLYTLGFGGGGVEIGLVVA